MLFASGITVTHRTLAPVDLVIIAVYFVMVFGIGFYFSRKERTSEDYFLAGRNIGWFAIGASLFVSNISTEHFIGLAGSGATSGLAGGKFRVASVLHPAAARLGLRSVLPALQRFHHAGISGAPLQPQLRHLPGVDFDHRLHLHENFRALVRCGHRAGARRRLESVDRRDHPRRRHRHLHHRRRTRRGHLHRPRADSDFAGRRDRAHLHRLGQSRRLCRTCAPRCRRATSTW